MKHQIELAKELIAENGLENFKYDRHYFGTTYSTYKQAKECALKYSIKFPMEIRPAKYKGLFVYCHTFGRPPIGIIAERMKDPTRDFSDDIAANFIMSFLSRPRERHEFEFVDVYRDEFQYDAISDYLPYTAETIKTINPIKLND
ncbi:hypothetical protein CFBP4996_15445 [Agrobacterium leguminum]|uniref:Uncharacterized protein n=1 Tax=Agrobacterium deltaense NCPPB 1641 TaxID=1183425 RepID=A0A1S7U2B6_9HYPH|nr:MULTISPECIES: hypothetical protein [Agrobacterium]WFS67422.1 hypothetical protein CFBP4996_15445 [Agrobacterium leguminum]CVI60979.1 hypothetical protein AGR7A_Lc140044 [Agrobacterium deltaense NCPPB 1641]